MNEEMNKREGGGRENGYVFFMIGLYVHYFTLCACFDTSIQMSPSKVACLWEGKDEGGTRDIKRI